VRAVVPGPDGSLDNKNDATREDTSATNSDSSDSEHEEKAKKGTDFQRFLNGGGRKKHVHCIVYSDDKNKIYWDIFIVILLVIVCTIIPWRLAFAGESKSWDIAYYCMDSMFLIDMILTFFTSIPSSEGMLEITDKK
jgi:hypothetical protein